MPKYDFHCNSCSAAFEITRSFSQADDPVICPACSQTDCQQAFSPPTFFSKGDRFEQAATARTHWAAKGQGTEIAGHEPPAIGWRHHGHEHEPGELPHPH
ncbi:MAG: zinc ribbon domain-containing protein [Dehalococcoidia bacterium]|nr:zinc ribbon domain-containing protein [Dehalococcoidia bacterium]